MSNSNNGLINVLWGALAGMAGGLVMMAMRKAIVPKIMPQQMQPDAFVPKEAVKWAEEKAKLPDAFSEEQEMKVAAGAHLGYSALMGSVYGLTGSKLQFMPPPLMGAAFGLGVWALSFEGWMPALGIKEKPQANHPRNGSCRLWGTWFMGQSRL